MSSNYNQGILRTALVLSTPSKRSDHQGPILPGSTYVNMELGIQYLHHYLPDSFPSANLFDYRIVKARLDNYSTQALPSIQDANVERLRNELEGIDTLLVLGLKAREAIEVMGYSGQRYFNAHPSNRHINFAYKSSKKTIRGRVEDRMQQWVNDVTLWEQP